MSGKESTSDSRDSGEQHSDRENYPYFTDEQFDTYNEPGMDLESLHVACQKIYEKRIANFSLKKPEEKAREKASHHENNLKIVLFGKTGSGKSLTANAILGQDEFISSRSSNSVTNVSLDNTCTYKNRRITVVDTPGIHDTNADKATITKELARMAFLLQDGVHCFVICISTSETRCTNEVVEMLQLIKQEGEGNFYDYCMLVYTKAETELERCKLSEFLIQKKHNEHFRRFLENINDRVVAVNNKCLVPAEALRNRDAIIEMVDVVVAKNLQNKKPVIFTNELFKLTGRLHAKLASVVQENNLEPILVNATIETIINKCSPMLTFNVFLDNVQSIIKMREESEVNNKFPDLCLPGTTKVNEKYTKQVEQIYDEINKEVHAFGERILRIVSAAAAQETATVTEAKVAATAVTAAVAGGATAVVAAETGTTAVGTAETGATAVGGAASAGGAAAGGATTEAPVAATVAGTAGAVTGSATKVVAAETGTTSVGAAETETKAVGAAAGGATTVETATTGTTATGSPVVAAVAITSVAAVAVAAVAGAVAPAVAVGSGVAVAAGALFKFLLKK